MFSAATKSVARPTSAAATDPFFSNVSLLLKGDGANNGTVITDSSSNAVAFTRVNSPVTSTVQSKFGGSSIWFERATSDHLSKTSATTDALFTFGTGDFTIEFWLYLNTASTVSQNIIDFRPTNGSGAYVTLTFFADNNLSYFANGAVRITGPAMAAGQWYHIAVSRVASQTRMYVNGSQVGATYADTTNYLLGASTRPYIGGGSYVATSDNTLNGYIDDLRITKGVGRYSGTTLTVPTAALPTGTITPPEPPVEVQKLTFSSVVVSTSPTITLPSTMQVGDVVVVAAAAATLGSTPTEVIPSGFTKVGSVTGVVSATGIRYGVYVRRITTAGSQSFTCTSGNFSEHNTAYIYRASSGTVATINLVQPQMTVSTGDSAALLFDGSTIIEPSALLVGHFVYPNNVPPTSILPADMVLVDNRTSSGGTSFRQYFKSYGASETTENGTYDIPDGGSPNAPYGFYLELTFA